MGGGLSNLILTFWAKCFIYCAVLHDFCELCDRNNDLGL